MYQTVYSPHILVSMPNTVQQSASNSIVSSNSNTTGSTLVQVQRSQVQPFEGVSPRQFIQCMGMGMELMAPLRNHHTIMPPPPHSYLKNNTTNINKNYNNNNNKTSNNNNNNNNNMNNNHHKHSHNTRNYWNSQTVPEAGDCVRSPTPRSYYDSDDSCQSQPHSPVPEVKGLKKIHDAYGTQPAFYQQSSLHSPGGFFYNSHHHSNNHNRSQNPTLSHTNNCTVYQNKRRINNNNNNNNNNRNNINRHRRSVVSGFQQLIAPDRYLARANEVEVRGEPNSLLNGSIWDNLSMAIWNKFKANQQTIHTYKNKMNLWKSLYILIKTHYPYGLYLVGSTISGFGSNTSDMDMCLLIRPTEMDQRCEAVVHLERIQSLLKQCEIISKVELIQAKVPILKFSDRKRYLEVDLNCNNSVGIRNTHLLRCYANMDWRVRPLVLIVKLWARHHHINDAKNMTISSYSLALMVIHYLQCGVTPPVIPCLQGIYPTKFSPHIAINLIDMHEQLIPFLSDNNQTLGELLLGFLHYYSVFEYNNYAISVRLGTRMSIEECKRQRSAKNDPHQWKHLCIEEPFDLTNTARSVYDLDIFEQVKIVFLRSYELLRDTRNLESIFKESLMPTTRPQQQEI